MPVDPGPCAWELPSAERADEVGVVAIGADLEPSTLLAAYCAGMFPMPVRGHKRIAWWSPDPRGVLPLDGLVVSRSLRRSCRDYEIRIDTAFEAVMRACGDPRRPDGWITEGFVAAYRRLHDLGWAHSVEAWTPDGDLAGGLYGIGIGGLFAGESMFHRRRDASKVALVALVDLLRAGGATLLDVQWSTEHLASLGVIELHRTEYLRRLAAATALDVDPWAAHGR